MIHKEFLYKLLSTPSVSGSEEQLQQAVMEHMREFSDEVRTDEIGDVVCILNPESPMRVLLSAHADEIGLSVTGISDQGFLYVTRTGGIYCETYPGHKVRLMTEQGLLYGSVVDTRSLAGKKDMKPEDLLVDIGASTREEAAARVRPGDVLTFDTDYRELLGGRVSARALDDRIGVFCIMEALIRAKERGCGIGVYSASTVGEETSKHGASWTAGRVQPTMSVIVDVTYTSDYEGTDPREYGDVALGKGAVLCSNPISHKKMNRLLEEAARRCGAPYQTEVSTGRTFTDADEIHFSGPGVPTAILSIPLRYMHTPAEVCDQKDVESCIAILTEFLCSLTEETSLNPFG